MLCRKSRFVIPVLGVVLAFSGAMKAQAEGPHCRTVSGTSSGTSTATGHPSFFVYNFDVSGIFKARPIGPGTYAGSVTLDYSNYTTASPCADVTGTITFTDAAGHQINTTVSGTECETTPYNADIHLSDLVLTITGGTGTYRDASGTIDSTGTTTGITSPYSEEAKLSGTICIPHLDGDDGEDD